jgi:protein involved in polysaccharide export with SLBB domain
VTARTIRVPLDSSYIFDRAPDGRYVGPPGLPAAAGPGPDAALALYDNVLILRQPDWKLLKTVVVTGEVRFPGKYTIANKNERIADLIDRAGGLTPEANPDGAYFSRRRSATSYQGLIDSARVRNDTASRVGLDIPTALRSPRDPDNLLLENGDSLDVPVQRSTIEIKGAVNAPTTVAAEKGQKLEHYIRAAGGPSRIALTGSAYVIQPNGTIESRHRVALLFRSDPTPRAGATIIVPVKDTLYNATAALTTYSIISGAIATLLTAFAVIKR